MATITITRGLEGLTSAFNQQSIEFTITTSVIPTVTVESIDFMPTKTATNIGGLDTYVMDFTDIFPYLLGFPPDDYTDVSKYRKEITISVSALAATTQTITTYLCFAYDRVGETNSLVYDIQTEGSRYAVYYNSAIGFYFNGANGNYDVSIGSSTQTETLVNGYNILSLSGDLSGESGLFVIDGYDTEFIVFYRQNIYSESTNKLIKWINKDGNYSEWDFRLVSTEDNVKSSNEIPNYKQTMAEMRNRTREISKEKTLTFNFDTVAIDTEHYSQLIKIVESPAVYYDDKIYKVADYTKTFAECRQNLKFNLSLELKDYVPTY